MMPLVLLSGELILQKATQTTLPTKVRWTAIHIVALERQQQMIATPSAKRWPTAARAAWMYQQKAQMTMLSGVPWEASQTPKNMMPLALLPEESIP